MTCDLRLGVGFYYSTESGSKLQIPLDVDGFQIFVSLIIILYFILNFHYIGDDGIRGEEDRLFIVSHGLRRPAVPAGGREARYRPLHQSVRQDQVLHGGDHQGSVHSQQCKNLLIHWKLLNVIMLQFSYQTDLD